MDNISKEDATKVFKVIDYNLAGVISKHQIRLFILFLKHKNDEYTFSEIMNRLIKMLLVTDLKVFNESLFVFFFTKKHPNKVIR